MTILSRPLFRQAGGPIQPPAPMPPMPAAAAARPAMPQSMPAAAAARPAMPAAPVPRPAGQGQGQGPNPAEGVRRLAERETMPLGQRAAQMTMQGIDAAQDPEGLINALRGNEKPIEARYAELAQFVGDQDARATPESVLALVQPALMLTQSGSVDSGIGELMQRLVGDITMEGESGPTPMGQGIGELMGQGAGPEPAGNFSAGPEIPGFQEGGEASRGRVDPELYERIYGQLRGMERTDVGSEVDEARKVAQAQALFDIAQGGLALAAGAPAGGSFAQQAAAAFAPVAGSLGKRGAEFFATERALKKEARAEDIALRKLAADMARSQDRAASMFEVRDENGRLLATGNVNNPAELASLRRAQSDNPNSSIFKVGEAPRPREVSLSEREQLMLSNPDLIRRYAEGKLDGEELARFEGSLSRSAREVTPTRVVVDGVAVERRLLPFSGPLLNAIRQRVGSGYPTSPILRESVLFDSAQATAGAAPAPATAGAAPAPATAGAAPAQAPLSPQATLESAFGTPSALMNYINKFAGFLGMNPADPAVTNSVNQVESLRQATVATISSAYPGRESNQLREQIGALVPEPVRFFDGGVEGARSKVKNLVDRLNIEIGILSASLDREKEIEAFRNRPGLDADPQKRRNALGALIPIRDDWMKLLGASASQQQNRAQQGLEILRGANRPSGASQ